MDSFSFKLTLKPWKIYVPTFENNFVDDLSKINYLKERLAALKKMKLQLEKEAIRLPTSGLEPFTMSMGFLKDAIKFLEEEEESMMKDMQKFQKPSTYMDMSQNTAKVEEAALRGRCLASKKTDNGISAKVEVCRDENIALRNSSSLYNHHLQMVQLALYRHKQRMMTSRREKGNGISSTVEGSRDEGSSSGNSNSVYSQHLQMIKEALSRYERSIGGH